MPLTPELIFESGTLLLKGHQKDRALGQLFGKHFWTWDARREGWVCDAIHWAEVVRVLDLELASGNWPFVTSSSSPDWAAVRFKEDGAPGAKLRDYQARAVREWEEAGQRGVIIMPTGTGKTEVGLEIMRRAPVPTLIVAPVRDLMYQWHRRISAALGYDAGIIGDSVFNVRPVSVTTYDSASIHMPRLGDRFELIIWDECHHLPGQTLADSARMSIAPRRLGLTATLERADGRHTEVATLIGPTVYELPLSEVTGSTLAEYEVRRIPVHLSEAEHVRFAELGEAISTYMQWRKDEGLSMVWEDVCADAATSPEARAAMRAQRMRKAIENRAGEKFRIIEDLFRLHPGDPCIIFAGSNQMAREVSEKFLIPCLLAHCGKKERLDILTGLEEGRYKAIVANQVLDEGVDLPSAKVAITIGGLSSTRQAKQRLGRILRRKGNLRATLYEVVCEDTGEVKRSRARRKSDAYARTRNHRLRPDAGAA